MDLKHPKWAIGVFCTLVALMGCENITEEHYTVTDEDLALTFVGSYGVAHPHTSGSHTNYVVLAVEAGDYTKGTYTLSQTAVIPTPVLSEGGRVSLIKIAAPTGGGGGGTALCLTVKEGETSVLEEETVTFTEAGIAAPEVLYGEKPMKFSEFFHDVTANITAIRPSTTAFAKTAAVAAPELFITDGTRSGTPAPSWTDADSQAKVDAISSATYGDTAHFFPTGNITFEGTPTDKTNADGKATGIKAVEVGVDFDLYANADLLRQASKAVVTSTEVLAQVDAIAQWKAATAVYKVKYLQPDASWGRRDDHALNDVAASWPKAIGGTGGATVNVTYGGNWADKVIAVDFAPLPSGLDSAGIWNTYFEQLYAGYVEDLQTGHKEPLVWLQNLFSHRGHTNLEAAIKRSGFSRFDSLSSEGNMRLVIFAKGYKDIIIESVGVVADGASLPSIEQGSAFYVSDADKKLLNSTGAELEEGNVLHVGNLSTAALEDFASKGGVIQKGVADIDSATTYELALEGEGEIAITIKDGFFTGAFQGSYTLKIPSTIPPDTSVTFAVNRIIERPKLKQGDTGTAADADTATAPIEVTKAGGNITIQNEDFAKAVVTSGRTVSSIMENTDGATAITGVIKQDETSKEYFIDPSALTANNTVYKLTIVTANFVREDTGNTPLYVNLNSVVYYIKVTG
ncbi:MAG: hypothetical protein LBD93_03250 [Treponema sp.]|jgi:hypothetical protein|nr:hypothetical protein [Treponema sp.]